jgi:O-antigen ligase
MILNGHSLRLGKQSRLFIFALSLLLISLIVGYARNSFSVFSIDFGDHETKMEGLAYLGALVGIMIFFSASWFFSITSLNENRLLRFFIIIAVIMALLKFTPLSTIIFDTSFSQPFITRSGALRLGGFDHLIWLAIPALIAYASQRINTLKILLIVVFLVACVIGGGRTLFFGIIFAIIIYLSLFYKKYSTRFVLACAVLILTIALTAQFLSLPTQIRRITGLTLVEAGGFAQQDRSRAASFSYYWDIFLYNPLFGKGIGVYKERLPKDLQFTKRQLIAGGHGAYLSILSTFGVVGAVFLVMFLFGAVFKSYKLVLMNSLNQNSVPYQKLAIFIFLYSLITVFYYVFGTNGFSDQKFYFVVGMLMGVLEKRRDIPPSS